jgi:hypothetical protein
MTEINAGVLKKTAAAIAATLGSAARAKALLT